MSFPLSFPYRYKKKKGSLASRKPRAFKEIVKTVFFFFFRCLPVSLGRWNFLYTSSSPFLCFTPSLFCSRYLTSVFVALCSFRQAYVCVYDEVRLNARPWQQLSTEAQKKGGKDTINQKTKNSHFDCERKRSVFFVFEAWVQAVLLFFFLLFLQKGKSREEKTLTQKWVKQSKTCSNTLGRGKKEIVFTYVCIYIACRILTHWQWRVKRRVICFPHSTCLLLASLQSCNHVLGALRDRRAGAEDHLHACVVQFLVIIRGNDTTGGHDDIVRTKLL